MNDHTVSIRNIVYESQLIKLFCLIDCIKERFGFKLNLEQLFYHLQFVKRYDYEWEKEIRISFNNSYKIGSDNINKNILKQTTIGCKLNEYFSIETDEMGDEYIEVPLINDFFELNIESISQSPTSSSIIT